jgi:predicted metal-dependent HD superfamily phosphohydrolase
MTPHAPPGDGFEDLLARVPVTDAVRNDLRRRMTSPTRRYHGIAHLALLWRRHHEFGVGSAFVTEPWDTRIACAIAFHDAVYDPLRADNEAASAALWRAARPAMEEAAQDWVAGTIEATIDHLGALCPSGTAATDWAARLWVLDLDLTPIGEAPEEFAANTQRLREEFAHVPEAAWEAGRLGFLRRLAAAPRIYRSPRLAAAFEAAARANIARELAAAG